jgi:hypothetical protein
MFNMAPLVTECAQKTTIRVKNVGDKQKIAFSVSELVSNFTLFSVE